MAIGNLRCPGGEMILYLVAQIVVLVTREENIAGNRAKILYLVAQIAILVTREENRGRPAGGRRARQRQRPPQIA